MEELVQRAREVALSALKDELRFDGSPFIGHPDAVAAIARDELGLIMPDEIRYVSN